MNMNNELRELTNEEVDAVEGGAISCREADWNAWDKWIYNNFFAPNEN
jgi:hypothetical protein